MKDNTATPQRNGTGCPVVEPEVLPVYQHEPAGDGSMQIGRLRFDRAAFVQSPCFWLLLGAGAAAGLIYLAYRDRR